MRPEAEVRSMIAEMKAVLADNLRRNNQHGAGVAQVVIAALRNVLDGPADLGLCGCMGPNGCCVCLVAGLKGEAPQP